MRNLRNAKDGRYIASVRSPGRLEIRHASGQMIVIETSGPGPRPFPKPLPSQVPGPPEIVVTGYSLKPARGRNSRPIDKFVETTVRDGIVTLKVDGMLITLDGFDLTAGSLSRKSLFGVRPLNTRKKKFRV